MKGNTPQDIIKTDDFNEFMISKGFFIRDENWMIYMNPSPVMIWRDGAKFEYTLAQALQDFKSIK